MDTPAPNLDELRRRLDAIDDRLHDLILERAAVVESVAALKQSTGQPSLRPGREAEILRRLDDWVRTLGPVAAEEHGFAAADPPTVSCTYLVYDAWSRTLSFSLTY